MRRLCSSTWRRPRPSSTSNGCSGASTPGRSAARVSSASTPADSRVQPRSSRPPGTAAAPRARRRPSGRRSGPRSRPPRRHRPRSAAAAATGAVDTASSGASTARNTMMVAVVDRRPMPQPRSGRQFPYSRGCRTSAGVDGAGMFTAGHHPGRGAPVNWFAAPRPAAAPHRRRDRGTHRAGRRGSARAPPPPAAPCAVARPWRRGRRRGRCPGRARRGPARPLPRRRAVPEPLPPEPPIWVPDQEKNFSKTGIATTARPSTSTPVRIVPRFARCARRAGTGRRSPGSR